MRLDPFALAVSDLSRRVPTVFCASDDDGIGVEVLEATDDDELFTADVYRDKRPDALKLARIPRLGIKPMLLSTGSMLRSHFNFII